MHKSVITLIALVVAPVWAQVAPVEDLGSTSSRPVVRPINTGSIAAPAPAPAAPNQALVDLHYEVQNMREEMRQLRGMVEEQANELRQLRQRQMDDYQDLDRRLGSMTASPATTQSASPIQAKRTPAPPMTSDSGTVYDTPPAPAPATPTPAFKPAQNPADEQAEYQTYTNNYNLLKARKIDESVAGFNNQVAKYPSGKYTANAYYWLGEIHLLQNNLPEAEKAFEQVTNNFPAHRKAADAAFKLGKVYHQQGKNDQARAVLQNVASGSSTAASLAQAYLDENF